MGQYHTLVNFDREETVRPRSIGLGLKQVEHTHTVAGLADVLYMLVTTSPNRGGGDLAYDEELEKKFRTFGRWAGDRVAVFGDYTEPEDVRFLGKTKANAICDDVEQYTDISDLIIPAFSLAFGVTIEPGKGWRGRELKAEEWSWLLPDLKT